ncbi:MAG: PHP domain-containing protein [Sarcina sp.]
MLFDTHMHSEYSFDSKMTVDEILEKQKELSIGITLTEHLDLDIEDFPVIDMDKYLKFYSPYRNDSFLLGIEIGLDNKNKENTIKFAQKYKNSLDIIVGSVHSLYGEDLFYLLKNLNMPKKELFANYLQKMLFCVENFDFFDTLAHIDYISRYANYEDSCLYLHEHEEIITKIFKSLIQKNKCLELNTRLINQEKNYECILQIFKKYKSLGGKYVTLASDAHSKDAIAANFFLAKKLLIQTNLTPVYFKKRKLHILNI